VRETWRASYNYDWFDDSLGRVFRPSDIPPGSAVDYLATGDHELNGKTRPAIFMPRWASRITLEITSLRIERLQAITATDAEAEGVFRHIAEHSIDKVFRDARGATAIGYFRELWEKLHGRGAWERNPAVVVIGFRLIEIANG